MPNPIYTKLAMLASMTLDAACRNNPFEDNNETLDDDKCKELNKQLQELQKQLIKPKQ